MFSPKSIAALVLAANVALSVPTWRRDNFPSRSEWKSKNLESYYKFKIRYRHIGCSEVEGTDFYNQCCVPLPKDQALPGQCSFSCSADYTPVPTASVPAPTDTHDGSDYSGDDGNDGEDDCEDGCEDDSDVGGDDTEVDDSNLPYCDEVGGDYEPITQPQEPTTPSAPEETIPTEPEPTTTEEPEPTTTEEPEPTTTEEPGPTTTEEPEPTTTAPDNNNGDGGNNGGDNSGNSDVQKGGYATWYEQDGNLGACERLNSDNDFIGAIDERRYGDSSHVSSECGRRVRITNTRNGKTVDIEIVDDCPTCENGNSIDLSLAAFDAIAERVEGMVEIEWYYLS